MNSWITDRRRFGIALGLGLLASKTLWGDDEIISSSEPAFVDWQQLAEQGQTFEHWTPEEDSQWKWYRLERYVDGNWQSVGISCPVNKETGELYQPATEYVSLEDIPDYVLSGDLPVRSPDIARHLAPSQFDHQTAMQRVPDAEIQLRDGRPPSDWLLSLNAEELRIWLESVDAPEAGVNGMTFWVHLVRDHSFDPRRIEGLTEHEFMLLHSAAHYGY